MSSHQIWWLLSEGNNAVEDRSESFFQSPPPRPKRSHPHLSSLPAQEHAEPLGKPSPMESRTRPSFHQCRTSAAVLNGLLLVTTLSTLARSGNGVLLDGDGMMLTTAHILEECAVVVVVRRDEQRLPARLLASIRSVISPRCGSLPFPRRHRCTCARTFKSVRPWSITASSAALGS